MFKNTIATITLLFSVLTLNVNAQTFYQWVEFGASVGGSQYFGDLNDHYGLKNIKPSFGILARYNLNHYISLRASANYTQLGYDDKFNKNAYQKMRNLNFKTDLYEATLQAEFNFFRFETADLESDRTPYVTVGLGAFYYNPYTVFNGNKYYLRPIGTEGQNLGAAYADRKYKDLSVCVPIGLGFKWWLVPGLNMGIEAVHRLTFTDYIDDVSATYVGANKFAPDPNTPNVPYYLQDPSIITNPSNPLGRAGKQRGSNNTLDQYMMVNFWVTYQLKTYKCPSNMGYYRTNY